MREATAWVVVGLGLTAMTGFLPISTPTSIRIGGSLAGFALVVIASRQLAIGARDRRRIDTLADELGRWISRAESAFHDIAEASDRDTKVTTYDAFVSACGDYISSQFGDEERRSFKGAPEKNIHGERFGDIGYSSGSILVLERWLERCRSRLLAGELSTIDGLRAPR